MFDKDGCISGECGCLSNKDLESIAKKVKRELAYSCGFNNNDTVIEIDDLYFCESKRLYPFFDKNKFFIKECKNDKEKYLLHIKYRESKNDQM